MGQVEKLLTCGTVFQGYVLAFSGALWHCYLYTLHSEEYPLGRWSRFAELCDSGSTNTHESCYLGHGTSVIA